jgi:hypothetical protein
MDDSNSRAVVVVVVVIVVVVAFPNLVFVSKTAAVHVHKAGRGLVACERFQVCLTFDNKNRAHSASTGTQWWIYDHNTIAIATWDTVHVDLVGTTTMSILQGTMAWASVVYNIQ